MWGVAFHCLLIFFFFLFPFCTGLGVLQHQWGKSNDPGTKTPALPGVLGFPFRKQEKTPLVVMTQSA
jgi:hypothetical protein